MKITMIFIAVTFFFITQSFAANVEYQYDNLHRLTRVERSDGVLTTYQYDELGNRTTKSVVANTTLSAQFTANPTVGRLPLDVAFTDMSTGDITSWLWDFGDGNTSTEKNPLHTYNAPGNFTVSLTVKNAGNVTDTKTRSDYINIEDIPLVPVLSVTPLSQSVSATSGTSSFNVSNTGIPGSDMDWTAISNDSWLTITSATSGTNTGTISFNYAANPGSSSRSGFLTITADGATDSPQTVTVEQAGGANIPVQIFKDNFDDNAIDTSKWITYGNRVLEESGILKTETTVTDVGGVANTQWLDINPTGILTIERKVKLHYGNEYSISNFRLILDKSEGFIFGIDYANMIYNSGQYCSSHGFFITRNGQTTHGGTCATMEDFSDRVEPIWDQWFDEKIIYHPTTGTLEYFINGQKKTEFNVGILPVLDEYKVKLQLSAWGWWTGHYHYQDDLTVTQESGEGDTDNDGLLTVHLLGNGSGRVISSPIGIDCGENCSKVYINTSSVTLSPVPSEGSTFLGWTGPCSGTDDCTIAVISKNEVGAIFTESYRNSSFVNIPLTGQTVCYDQLGNSIDCHGTGQDGEQLAGIAWPNPRFKDNGDGTITDNLTGLMWLKDANCFGSLVWNSIFDAVENLNSNGVSCGCNYYSGNYQDWRIPNANEIGTLVNLNELNNAAWLSQQGFENLQSTYWTSTSEMLHGTPGSRAKYFGTAGYGYLTDKISEISILPVRNETKQSLFPAMVPATGQQIVYHDRDDGDLQKGETWPAPRFTDNGDGTATDRLTGLMWLKDAACLGLEKWENAFSVIKNFNENNSSKYSCRDCNSNYTDWRLPNRNELQSLLDLSQIYPALTQDHPFIDMQTYNYWSSTTVPNMPEMGWAYHLWSGNLDKADKNTDCRIMAVRGGYSNIPSESSIILIDNVDHNFGVTIVNDNSNSHTINIKNVGKTDLFIKNIQIHGENSSDFIMADNDCSYKAIEPSGSCSFAIMFSPVNEGFKNATLSISSNDASNPLFDIVLTGYAIKSSVNLPKTGEQNCYDNAGKLINCSGTGQDGDIQAGVTWPNPRFLDNEDGTITDNLTGLMWLQDGSGLGKTFWPDAKNRASTFNTDAETFNCANYSAQYSDWRLPNINELESLINEGKMNQADWLNSQGFIGIENGLYWTANAKAGSQNCWAIHFASGTYAYEGIGPYSIILVRAGQLDTPDMLYPANVWKTSKNSGRGVEWPSDRFIDNKNGTITDRLTGLMWLKDANCWGVMRWSDAYKAIANINQYQGNYPCEEYNADYQDWRLPNRKELLSLIDWSKSGILTALPDSHPFIGVNESSFYYWTSSSYDPSVLNAIFISIDSGSVSYREKNEGTPTSKLWLVRGGTLTENFSSVSIAPSEYDFGDVVINTISTAQKFSISNSGTSVLSIGDILLSNGNTNEFIIQNDSCSGSLVPTSSECSFDLIFSPSVVGLQNTSISIHSNDPLSPVLSISLSGNGVYNDSDYDGLSDNIEEITCTDTNDADTDNDGILDGSEDVNHDGNIASDETSPCDPDTDNDGILDGTEIGLYAPQNPDATNLSVGNFIADQDTSTTTDPTNPDSDGDGFKDGQEDSNHNGRVDFKETDPNIKNINPPDEEFATIYEDAEDGSTTGWSIYANVPAGASIQNVYDAARQSNVISFVSPNGTSNGYRLRNADGSLWNNTTQFILQWSMKYSQNYTIYIDVQTSLGHRYLVYDYAASDALGSGEYVKFGLGVGSKDGKWHTYARDLEADLKRAQPANSIIQVNGFLIRGSGMVDDIKLMDEMPAGAAQTIYENAEDGTTTGWSIYANVPAGASIQNVYDAERQSNVISFVSPNGTSNGYRLRNADGSVWNNTTQFVLQWSMKYSQNYTIYIDVQTSLGHRYLVYDYAASDALGSGEYVKFGLGAESKDGKWHTYIRDLEADLKRAQPANSIVKVNGFLIRGSGMVDDIKLMKEFPGTIYENAEDGTTAGWSIYANVPAGASIQNVYEAARQSNVISFVSPNGTSNGYRLRNADGSLWNNTTQFILQWSMKYSQNYTIYIDVQTSLGHRYLVYDYAASDALGSGEYVKFGFGAGSKDGKWHTYARDLEADLKRAQPSNSIVKVNGFLIRGSGMVDDIKLIDSNSVKADRKAVSKADIERILSQPYNDPVEIPEDEIIVEQEDYSDDEGPAEVVVPDEYLYEPDYDGCPVELPEAADSDAGNHDLILDVGINQSVYHKNDRLRLDVEMQGEQLVDLYLAIFFPDGSFTTMIYPLNFSGLYDIKPYKKGIQLSGEHSFSVLDMVVTESMPLGEYIFYGIAVPTGSDVLKVENWLKYDFEGFVVE